MTTVSLAMIVRDAETTLARALECAIELCDELVVVDTGSLDRTEEIAAQMGAVVHHFAWIDDFSAARNYSFDCCTSDWIFLLDADDVISESSILKLLEVKNGTLCDTIDGVFLPYQCAFDSQGKSRFTFYRERLLRKQANLRWKYPVHEQLNVPPERSLFLKDIFIEHRPTAETRATKAPNRNLKIIEKALSNSGPDERMLFYYGNELYDHDRYEDAIKAYLQFLDIGGRPWERYWAYRNISKCYSSLAQLDRALEWGLLAIEAGPERAEAHNDVGMIYYRQNRFTEAISFFSDATKLQKPETGFVEDCHYEWLPYDYLSSCYMGTGDYPKALEYALKASPHHPEKDRLEENIRFLTRLS